MTPQPVSDESSSDENATRSSRRKILADGIFPPGEGAPAISYEPLPIQTLRSSVVSSLKPYNMLAQASFVSSNQYTLFGATRTGADEILDDAAEQLFNNDPAMSDMQELAEIWDGSEFGEDVVQDDIQLGYMLEKLLEE
jgi:hypothetical protein